MHTNDSQLISAVLQGDKNGYEPLIEKYKKMVYGIAWSHLGDSDLSEDAAQETFIKAYTYLATLREPDKFQGWLARIARNVSNSLSRRAKRDNAFKERWALLESAEPQSGHDERESPKEHLWQSFSELTDTHREALTLFYIEGKNVVEAAEALGVTEQALRTRLHRARLALRMQLEQKLEETLGDLQPRKDFTRSVLVLLPLSPKGAIGSGGALAVIFGKLFASLSFIMWMAAAQSLIILGLFTLYSKLDEANIKDTPENQPRKAFIRRDYMKAAVVIPASIVVSFLLMRHFTPTILMQVISIVYAYMLWRALKPLRVNRSPEVIGNVLGITIMFAAICAIGFFGASSRLFYISILLASIVLYIATAKTSPQWSYNPFYYGAIYGCTDLADDTSQLNHKLNRTDMSAFAGFIGEMGVVRDYRFRGDSIILVLASLGDTTLTKPIFGACSEVVIASDGTCVAMINNRDLDIIRKVRPGIDSAQLQDQVCRTTRYALSCFLNGNQEAARDVLSVKPDEAAHAQSRGSVMRRRIKGLATLFISVASCAALLGSSTIRMFALITGGILASICVMAITLYITRRQDSSL